MLHACIVDEDIDLAEGVIGCVDHQLDLVWLPHVGVVVNGLHAEFLFQGGPVGFDFSGIPEAVQQYRATFRCEGPRVAKADPARGSCDDGCFTVEKSAHFHRSVLVLGTGRKLCRGVIWETGRELRAACMAGTMTLVFLSWEHY